VASAYLTAKHPQLFTKNKHVTSAYRTIKNDMPNLHKNIST